MAESDSAARMLEMFKSKYPDQYEELKTQTASKAPPEANVDKTAEPEEADSDITSDDDSSSSSSSSSNESQGSKSPMESPTEVEGTPVQQVEGDGQDSLGYEGSKGISATSSNVKDSSVSPPVTSTNATSNLQDSMSKALVSAPFNTSGAQTASVKYQVSDYFSKGSHPAKRKMRHMLRKAAHEVEALGTLTYREITPGRRKHIKDRVISVCPELSGHEYEIDKVMKRMLIQAKSYRKGHKMKESGADKGTDSKTMKKSTSKQGKVGLRKDSKKRKKKSQTASKHKPKMKKTKPAEEMSPYELQRMARIRVNKRIQEAVMTKEKTSLGISPGDNVMIHHNKISIASCKFIKQLNDVYAELAFDYHTGVATEEPVELQRHVEEDKELKRPKKSFVQDLEEGDIFEWKIEKISIPRPLRGTITPVNRYGSK